MRKWADELIKGDSMIEPIDFTDNVSVAEDTEAPTDESNAPARIGRFYDPFGGDRLHVG
jgi:hypothetical protein